MRQRIASFAKRYTQFVERQGFTIIVTVCVLVIGVTAAWTRRAEDVPGPAPTLPVVEDLSASRLFQEPLSQATTPTPAPTPPMPVWRAPLESVSVLTAFDATRVKRSSVTGLWRVHDAVDLAAETGEIVSAMADGVCVSVEEKGLEGASVSIDHGGGVIVQYAGMAKVAPLRAGDPVSAGQTVGFAGNGMMDETDLPAHLHLRATRDGNAIDPLRLLSQNP